MDLHPTAASGFEAAAAGYDRFRPGYPTEAIEVLADRLALGPGRTILDLAAGTGKLTRPLVATGAEVIAIEPVPAMRRELARLLPALEVRDGRAESIPVEDGSVDAVAVGQAFHWFDAPRALAEIRRVVTTGGWLAVIFNTRELSSRAQAAVDDLLVPYRGETPSWTDHSWRETLEAPDGFEAPELVRWPHQQIVDRDGLVGRVASVSFVADLDTTSRARLLRATAELYDQLEADGSVILDYTTELRLLRRSQA